MNKGELVSIIARTHGMSNIAATQALNVVLAYMADAMENGERVSLRGFGSFRVLDVAVKKGRNISTGECILVPAHRTVKFKAGRRLCAAL